jgi:hypothetical protein
MVMTTAHTPVSATVGVVTGGKSKWRRRLLKGFAGSVFLGLLLAFISFFGAAYNRFSVASEFAEIQVGMQRYQVQKILWKGAIMCDLNYDRSATKCTFSDFWRAYIVELDPATNRVVRKGFQWRRYAYY